MISAIIVNVSVRSKSLLILDNSNLKARDLKKMEKILKRTEKMSNTFIKTGMKRATPNILAGVAAKTRSP